MKKKRTFNDVWDLIDISVYVIVGYALLEFFFQINSYINEVFPVQILTFLLMIFGFGSIGYMGLKEKLAQEDCAKHGAYAGLIVGFLLALIGIITIYIYPERIAEAIQQAAQQGADAAMVETMVKVFSYVNLILLPAIYAGLGALFAWLSALIFKKKLTEKKKK
jgi:uncharacterized membrane protein YbhN (UPF0104 family)